MILAIWNLVILGSLFLICLIVCGVMIYLVRKQTTPNSASNRLIKKMTVEKSFKEGLFNKEDSTCAICLSEYEENEKIRILRCEHHFHSECIIVWLKKNKVCPFCKREIDGNWDIKKEKEERSQQEGRPNEEEVSSLAEDEEQQLIRRPPENPIIV